MERDGRPRIAATTDGGWYRVADGRGELLERILDGLSRPRSRHVMYCLADEDPRDIDELAATVAEMEFGTSPTAEQRESVKIDIYHNVVPKLHHLQLVEYDNRSQMLCFRDPPEELEAILERCRDLEENH